jgi:hypothetical protein
LKFSTKELRYAIWGDSEELELVSNEHNGSSRWSEHRYLVFKHEGKLYGVGYSKGLTECQSEDPFEYDGDEIECDEVEAVEVVTIEYRVKK